MLRGRPLFEPQGLHRPSNPPEPMHSHRTTSRAGTRLIGVLASLAISGLAISGLTLSACSDDAGSGEHRGPDRGGPADTSTRPGVDGDTPEAPDRDATATTDADTDTGDPVIPEDVGVGEPCDPASAPFCVGERGVLYCDPLELTVRERECPGGQICQGGECGSPTGFVCNAAGNTCNGTHVARCNDDGTPGELVETCSFACAGGACLEPCVDEKSYFGCAFFALDLDNHDGTRFGFGGTPAAAQDWAVSISNPNEGPVTVTITQTDGPTVVDDLVVGALSVERVVMPRLDVGASSHSRRSFLIETSGPVTAHQFNPINNVNVFSNDASLLLPTHALGRRYRVLAWPTEVVTVPILGDQIRWSYVTFVGATPGTTTVTVTAPPNGAVLAGDGVPSIAGGASHTFTLQFGDVVGLQSASINRNDFTGMVLEASSPIAVFSGSECSFIPLSNNYCDHLETQLFPTETWGTHYVAAKFQPRGTEPDVYRILADQNGTTILTDPPQPGANGVVLSAGEFVEFESRDDFLITGSNPISVAQFMVGSSYPGFPDCQREADPNAPGPPPNNCAIPADRRCVAESGIGDPAFLTLVPENQLRTDYLVLTPEGYHRDYLTIVAPSDADIAINDAPVTATRDEIPGTTTSVMRIPVEPGTHRLVGTAPFALYAYGYDCDVSYAYAGGSNLDTP